MAEPRGGEQGWPWWSVIPSRARAGWRGAARARRRGLETMRAALFNGLTRPIASLRRCPYMKTDLNGVSGPFCLG